MACVEVDDAEWRLKAPVCLSCHYSCHTATAATSMTYNKRLLSAAVHEAAAAAVTAVI